jgi:hypothetical protein
MDNKKYKSRKDEPVYSSTYDNGGWPERDSLPTGDPIGDIDERKKTHLPDIDMDKKPWDTFNITYDQYKKDMENYINTMKARLLVPQGKMVENKDFGVNFCAPKQCCSNPQKHKNIISNSLKFYVCKNCGADLGDC